MEVLKDQVLLGQLNLCEPRRADPIWQVDSWGHPHLPVQAVTGACFFAMPDCDNMSI